MKKTISIIGGGPAALALATFLDADKFNITLFEKNKTLGRKLLVAGKGGFNLTHSEPIAEFIKRYTPDDFLEEALLQFDNQDLRNWLEEIGVPTAIGTSKRVYPAGFLQRGEIEQEEVTNLKPIEVLNKMLTALEQNEVNIKADFTWQGWTADNNLIFNQGLVVQSDYTVFALGGASWKITGSDGSWLSPFQAKGIVVQEFQPSNCAYQVNWPREVKSNYAGFPLKNIAISALDKYKKGEVVLTEFGLEGNAIYALSPQIRKQLNEEGKANIFLDLKPTLNPEELLIRFQKSKFKKTSDILRNDLKLSGVQIALLKALTSKATFLNPSELMAQIKALKIEIIAMAELDEAISTIGGVSREAVDKYFQLKKLPDQYCIGEMLDWDTPTGGYLLQACFSMGVFVARRLNQIA